MKGTGRAGLAACTRPAAAPLSTGHHEAPLLTCVACPCPGACGQEGRLGLGEGVGGPHPSSAATPTPAPLCVLANSKWSQKESAGPGTEPKPGAKGGAGPGASQPELLLGTPSFGPRPPCLCSEGHCWLGDKKAQGAVSPAGDTAGKPQRPRSAPRASRWVPQGEQEPVCVGRQGRPHPLTSPVSAPGFLAQARS